MAGVGGERPAAPEPPGTSQPLTAFILPLPPRPDVSGGGYAGGNGGGNRSTVVGTTGAELKRHEGVWKVTKEGAKGNGARIEDKRRLNDGNGEEDSGGAIKRTLDEEEEYRRRQKQEEKRYVR